LKQTRWPERETVNDWSEGVPLARMQALVEYWSKDYDWRRCEAKLNRFPQFCTKIDGLNIHFLHVRSPHENALPIIITHGWPGSVIEFLKVIDPLTDPTAHGGRAEDAFRVVVPSLPGFGFSDKPSERIHAGTDVQGTDQSKLRAKRKTIRPRAVVVLRPGAAGKHCGLLVFGFPYGRLE
jgi:pimeloyl-ACP methyl ester carboxylesterase